MDRFSDDDDNTTITLADWQALGFDEHSLIANPDQLFVAVTNNDYHLKPNAPAIDAGTTRAPCRTIWKARATPGERIRPRLL